MATSVESWIEKTKPIEIIIATAQELYDRYLHASQLVVATNIERKRNKEKRSRKRVRPML
jgi:hypothetical protein